MDEAGRRMFPVLSGRPFETWQIATVRLPVWLPKNGKPTRYWIVVCRQDGSGLIEASEPAIQEEISPRLATLLPQAGRKWRSRPARLEVTEPELARALEALVAPEGVTVARVSELPELREAINNLVGSMTADDPRPSPLTGDGVTVERLRAFARAAANLYGSLVWRLLTGFDLVEVESPAMEGFRCFLFSHHDRAALRGLMFFPSRAFYSEMMNMPGMGPERALWALEFEPAWDSPLSDLDLWERFGLPWAGEERCPVAYLLDAEEVERPDSRQLAFLEGLAAALAATSEQDLDSGRWEQQVSTAEGDMRFVLALPGVREPEEAPVRPAAPWAAAERTLREVHKLIENHQFASLEEANQFLARALEQGQPKREPETPEERAEELVGQAWDCQGRRAVHLARQALEIWPDCADAYNVLASRAPDDEAAHGLYVQAIAAGKRALGPEIFQEHTGHFWSFLEGRPYMRAVEGAAETLRDLGRLDESVEHYREMLRLNTNDNQGGRYALVNVLIAANRAAEADELLAAHEKDDGALMAFPRALLTFRREGDSFDARRHLKRALRANRFVPGLLLGIRSLPAPTDTYSPGREDEAAFYCLLSYGTWEKTSGALDWLRQRASPPSQPPADGRPAGSRRKKTRRRGRG